MKKMKKTPVKKMMHSENEMGGMMKKMHPEKTGGKAKKPKKRK